MNKQILPTIIYMTQLLIQWSVNIVIKSALIRTVELLLARIKNKLFRSIIL